MINKEFKLFADDTLDDALCLVRQRFPAHAVEITCQALANPNLPPHGGAGIIGYRDGRPVAFQLEMLRKVYCGDRPLDGLIGGMTCKALKGCPLSVLLETMERASSLGDDIGITFGNTCCTATSQIDETGGGTLGPPSCTFFRYAVLRLLDFVRYVIRRKFFKLEIPHWKAALPVSRSWGRRFGELEVRREFSLDKDMLDSFWNRYLHGNSGCVVSRTYDELSWLFKDRIATSQCVFLGAFCGNDCVGYLILTSPAPSARRWIIGDMIAIRNEASIIELLLSSAKQFLRKCTPAFLFETIGFSQHIQKNIKRHLPFIRKAGCNYFAYAFTSNELKNKYDALLNSPESWFFGPYDGDMCM